MSNADKLGTESCDIEEALPLAETVKSAHPPLPPSRIGVITRTKKIDGSSMIYRVEDEEFFVAPSNPGKAFRLQQLRFDDGAGFEAGHTEYRVCYYMIAHRPRMKGKWAFGQFAPLMTPEELSLIVSKLHTKGWLSD
jgi:hypothetical protein